MQILKACSSPEPPKIASDPRSVGRRPSLVNREPANREGIKIDNFNLSILASLSTRDATEVECIVSRWSYKQTDRIYVCAPVSNDF